MKKLSLLSVVLLASLAAQAYVPLVREGVKWVYHDEYNDFDEVAINGWVVNRNYTIEFKGDTIIDGKTYKKCYRQSDVDLNGKQNAMFCSDTEPVAFVREENGVVYSINKVDNYIWEPYLIMLRPDFNYDSNEQVIYDFNNIDNAEVTTVEVGGIPCKAIKYNRFGLVVESIGVDNIEGGDLLCPVPDFIFSTSMWYSWISLHHVEDAQGNIIYKGKAYQESESHPFDLNGDGQVDVSDVNLIIDYILGK